MSAAAKSDRRPAIKIPRDLHKLLKVRAVREEVQLRDLVERLLRQAVRS
jgi:predicted HicB family RNase H-like nuclease